jgi:hypothetical protein
MKKDELRDFTFTSHPKKSYPDETDMKKTN